MNQRFSSSPEEVRNMDTGRIRQNFLVDDLMQADRFNFTYSHYDRVIIGSVIPLSGDLELPNYNNFKI